MDSNNNKLEALAIELVQRETGASRVAVKRFVRLGGGAIQENYAVDLEVEGGSQSGSQALVLRTNAPSRLMVGIDRAQEFAVLRQAFAAGVRVPEPLWLHCDPADSESDFYLMRRVPGTASARALVRAEMSEVERDSVVAQLGEQLGRLHRVRPPVAQLDFLPLSELPAAQARVAEYRGYLDAMGRPRPTLELALRWLELNAPETQDYVLCHGDYRTGNYMIEQGQLSGILDWEFAGWSDPLEDLGWLCARCWRFGVWEREVGGIGSLDALLRGYEQGAGRRIDASRLPYWRVMATVRWGIIALMQAERHLSGEQHSLELALTGRMLPEMELDLLQEISLIEKEGALHA